MKKARPVKAGSHNLYNNLNQKFTAVSDHAVRNSLDMQNNK